MTPQRWAKLNRVLSARQPTLTVLMENVHKPHNYSAVLRTCDAVGVYEAHAISADRLVQTSPLSSASAAKWVKVHVHDDLQEAWVHLRAFGFRLLAAHLSEQAVDFREVDYTEPCAILLGAEKEGVTEQAAALADEHIIIPQHGMVQSLNVSVAAAIILFEAQRQRAAAGMYDTCSLDPELYAQTIFEWGYPKLAPGYRWKGEPYPELDDDGEIIG